MALSPASLAGRRAHPASLRSARQWQVQPAAGPISTPLARRHSTSVFVYLFIFSLALPLVFYAGPVRLSPYRALLLALFVPCLMSWLAGGLGRIRLPDVLVLLASLWGMLALAVHHGVEVSWEPSGILLVETFGAYLLGRKLIRTEENFRAMVRILFWTIGALLPFAVIESLTGRAVLLEMLEGFASVIGNVDQDTRFGFHRAQVAFEHPILYGMFCASGIGLAYYVMGPARSTVGRVLCAAPMVLAAMCSLSAGAAASIISQFGLASWDRVMRPVVKRWRLLAALCVAAYVSIDVLSNRTPFHVLVTYLTFSPETGYSRIMIWNWGIAEVMRHPVFGIGLNEWERPLWKSGSMDNFWLVVAVRYGVPAFLFLAGAVALTARALGRADLGDERIRACRAGLLVALAGLVIAGCTVHFWNALYAWFMFLIGSSIWMLDQSERRLATSDPGGGKGSRALNNADRQSARAVRPSMRTRRFSYEHRSP